MHDELPKKILSLMDLTSLNDNDNDESITKLCQKAVTPFGHVAAVCVYPKFIKRAKHILDGSHVKIASVANFPKGDEPLDRVIYSIKQSITAGADEIDLVFPYQQYLAGQKDEACAFVHKCKITCGDKVLLKVILETGAFHDPQAITYVSHDVLVAGADFIKTSTGKIAEGATLQAATAMLMSIKDLSSDFHHPYGLKVSGGIRTTDQAGQYIELANEIMGHGWVVPRTFRIGASQLLDEIIKELSSAMPA